MPIPAARSSFAAPGPSAGEPRPPRSLGLRLRGGTAVFFLAVTLLGAAERRPNLLLVLTDDQGYPTLSCYGGTQVPTPHLDRLAREGLRFTDAYVMPQCTPTRAALLTGQHTARHGMWHVIPWYGTPWAPVREPAFRESLTRETFLFPKGLRAAGYATGTAGKWHLTNNADGNYVAIKAEAAAHYGFDYSAPPGPGSQNEGDKHVDYLTDQAIDFIRRHREQPWFFYLAHHTVHGKVSAPSALVEKYRAAGAPATGLHHATYLAALEHLDRSVGRLVAAIDELGLRERTLVVFVSDNGGVYQVYDMKPFTEGPGTAERLTVASEEFSNAPLRAGKGSAYEGGIRVSPAGRARLSPARLRPLPSTWWTGRRRSLTSPGPAPPPDIPSTAGVSRRSSAAARCRIAPSTGTHRSTNCGGASPRAPSSARATGN
ncbi:MAG: sulfatase-like hydrolase/transferase [Verrucomicrobia bacterium]|nr:sulfatase-like hydrolase/transferase [Verrucomicrobiota bacterium]